MRRARVESDARRRVHAHDALDVGRRDGRHVLLRDRRVGARRQLLDRALEGGVELGGGGEGLELDLLRGRRQARASLLVALDEPVDERHDPEADADRDDDGGEDA